MTVRERSSRGRLAPALLLSTILLCAAFAGQPVFAFIPKGDRIAKAAADANKAGERTQALQLELTLRVAERDPIGTGELVTHPTGLARLELRDAGERVERHLLVGTDHTASRNGELLSSPRPFLPPLFLLQVDSRMTFRQALSDHGLDADAVALAPCGTRVCYVIGDPGRVAEPSAEPDVSEGGAPADAPEAEEVPRLPEPTPADEGSDAASEHAPRATIWIDTETFEVRRMLLRDGVAVDFGPFVDWKDVRFPESITITEPVREPVRFDILAVTPVNAPAAEFRRAWLIPAPEAAHATSTPEPDAVPAVPDPGSR